MNYSNNYYASLERIKLAHRKQVIALLLSFLYCIYALMLLQGNNQDEYYQFFGRSKIQTIPYDYQVHSTSIDDTKQPEEEVEFYYEQDNVTAVVISSHIQLCSHLMPRLEHAHAKHKADMKAAALGLQNHGFNLENIPELNVMEPESGIFDHILVEEDESRCLPNATIKSLLEIFSSTLLDEAAARFQLNIEYKQNCNALRFNRAEGSSIDGSFSIQEMLPDDLLGSQIGLSDLLTFDVLAMKNLCKDCLRDDLVYRGDQNCVLFNKPLSLQAEGRPGIEAIFPIMKESLRRIAERWKTDDEIRMLEKFRVQYHPPLTLVNNPTNTSDENVTMNVVENDLKTDPKLSYVVYITCVEEDCNDVKDSIALPFHYFTDHMNRIKSDISSVSVIVSEPCASHVDGCFSYGQALFSTFSQHFPMAQIELIQTPSTYHVYSQMFLADYIFCPPSHSCLLPAMLSDGFALLATQDEEMISHWPKELIKSSNTILLKNFKGKSVTKLDHQFLVGK